MVAAWGYSPVSHARDPTSRRKACILKREDSGKGGRGWGGLGEVGWVGGCKQDLLSLPSNLQYFWRKSPTFRKWF